MEFQGGLLNNTWTHRQCSILGNVKQQMSLSAALPLLKVMNLWNFFHLKNCSKHQTVRMRTWLMNNTSFVDDIDLWIHIYCIGDIIQENLVTKQVGMDTFIIQGQWYILLTKGYVKIGKLKRFLEIEKKLAARNNLFLSTSNSMVCHLHNTFARIRSTFCWHPRSAMTIYLVASLGNSSCRFSSARLSSKNKSFKLSNLYIGEFCRCKWNQCS